VRCPHLSIHDGFAFALAESRRGSIFLTGDGGLRALAVEHGMEVHGVLWVIDKIHTNKLAHAEALLEVLRGFAADESVRLPRRDLAAQIRRYAKE
jgi:hypothetical protein